MKPAISVQNLGKSYRVSHQAGRKGYRTLRESLAGMAAAPLRRLRGSRTDASSSEEFWALKDVNFDVTPGEVVGIIGRNGAGKSTLLKILSRITKPSRGEVAMNGRVGSLLEVGTGFHPELTGRENVYLNGSILGMSRRDIQRKFDAIIDFAGIERFLDTPVKRYSSGMYVRLAFSVAAHLNPEILLVDEVLAVGDAEFQRKCLGKMEEVGKEGRTVIFVSHSMATIMRLCPRVIMVDRGHVAVDGSPNHVIGQYLCSGTHRAAERVWSDQTAAPGSAVGQLRAARVLDAEGNVAEAIDINSPCTIEVEYANLQSDLKLTVSIHILNEEGITILASNDWNNQNWWRGPRAPGLVRARCAIPRHLLAEGRFFVLVALCSYNPDVVHAEERDAVSFQIVESEGDEGVRGAFGRSWPGVVRPMLSWEIRHVV